MYWFYKNLVRWLLGVFLIGAVPAYSVAIELSPEELLWIKNNPVLTVANETDWPPFDYVDNGKPAGYSIDVMRLIAQKTGLEMKFVSGFTWQQLLEQFKAGKIDILPALFINDERLKYISFTKSYYSQPSVMVVHENNTSITKIEHLKNKRVAGVNAYSFTNALKKNVPTASIVKVNNILEGLKAVSLGDADAFVDSIGTISYLLENNYIPNIKIISQIEHPDLTAPSIHMGVAKDKGILRRILDKALAAISRDEKRILSNTWFHTVKIVENEKLPDSDIFTTEQQAWLQQHAEIKIGIMNAWAPMDYVTSSGKPAGIGVQFIDAINKRLGNRLKIVAGLWKDNLDAVKDKRLDALMDITPRPDREQFFHFTQPYIEVPHLIYTRNDAPAALSLFSLKGKTIGVEKGFFIVNVLKEKYPTIKVEDYRTTSDALDALSKGEVDAYIGNRAVANYIIENELINNVKAQGKISGTSSINAIGVRKDWVILRDILQRALDSITPLERSQIINFNHNSNKNDKTKSELFAQFSSSEIAWLKSKPIIRLGVDSEWPPIEWIDKKGKHQGMTSDYIKYAMDLLDLKVEQPTTMPWLDVLHGVKHERIDLTPAVVPTTERQEYMNFTSTYLSFPLVIFTRDGASFVANLQDLHGKRVGVESGYASQEKLQRNHPELSLTTYNTTQEILHELSVGKIDAYVGNLTVAVYILNKEGLTNIKVAAPTPYSFELSVGVRKGLPELHSIMEKTLAMMSVVQRNEIRQRWLKLNYEVGVDYALVQKILIAISIVVLLILGWVFFIQRQKRILREAKAETDLANEAYALANEQLLQANLKLKELDRMKSMFVASISHELRTPLNSIIGFSSLMMHGSFGKLNDKYTDYTSRINNSGQHLLSLITDIIDISKIESGRIDVVVEDFTLEEITSEAVASLSEQVDKKGLLIDLQVPLGVKMHTDKRRLYQCLLNFLSNAVKYSESGLISLSAEEKDECILLKVSDNGIGIHEADMPRLFEAFERMESHLQVKAGGTGLGLYLTKKIAEELLQGNVGAESRLGKGSTFWIKVPKNIE